MFDFFIDNQVGQKYYKVSFFFFILFFSLFSSNLLERKPSGAKHNFSIYFSYLLAWYLCISELFSIAFFSLCYFGTFKMTKHATRISLDIWESSALGSSIFLSNIISNSCGISKANMGKFHTKFEIIITSTSTLKLLIWMV